jgi:hypothetical protein
VARTTLDPRERASLERLADDARTALNEGRPMSLGARLEMLADALEDEQFALLARLSDDLPALLAAAGVTPTRIASMAQLQHAHSFLDAL